MDVKSAFALLIVLPVACLLLIAGCNPSPDSADESDADKTASKQNPEQLLVGTWYGKAKLDQALLQQKLNATQDPLQRQTLLNISQTFQTAEIGARFGSDGSLLLEIQIRSGGQVMQDSTRGTWRTLEIQDNAIFVETTESLPGGGTETNQVRYQFEQQGQRAIMVAPTSRQLADCNPLFVFDRVVAAPAKVADRAADAVIK